MHRENVLNLTSWFGVIPYAGVILTEADEPEDKTLSEYKVTSNAFLFGGKVRVRAPIPWVAPYLEAGVGASLGSFQTYTPYNDIENKGLLMHIPFSCGLELGRKHNFDFGFTYYYHPSAKQFAGAVAVGMSFPID